MWPLPIWSSTPFLLLLYFLGVYPICCHTPILFSMRSTLAFPLAVPFMALSHILLSPLIFSFLLQYLDTSICNVLFSNIWNILLPLPSLTSSLLLLSLLHIVSLYSLSLQIYFGRLVFPSPPPFYFYSYGPGTQTSYNIDTFSFFFLLVLFLV